MPKLEYELSIYPFHIDAIGHVNNIVYVQWMEIGRVHLLNAIGLPIEQVAKAGIGPALIETSISYKKALYLGARVPGTIWFSKLGSASAVMSIEFRNQQGEIAAIGTQKGLFINLESKKPTRLTAEQRDRFSPYFIAPDS